LRSSTSWSACSARITPSFEHAAATSSTASRDPHSTAIGSSRDDDDDDEGAEPRRVDTRAVALCACDAAFAIARTRSATVGSLKAPAPKATAKCLAPSITDRN
jgi:hypothetical protein